MLIHKSMHYLHRIIIIGFKGHVIDHGHIIGTKPWALVRRDLERKWSHLSVFFTLIYGWVRQELFCFSLMKWGKKIFVKASDHSLGILPIDVITYPRYIKCVFDCIKYNLTQLCSSENIWVNSHQPAYKQGKEFANDQATTAFNGLIVILQVNIESIQELAKDCLENVLQNDIWIW